MISRKQIVSSNSKLIIIVLGLVFILVGNGFNYSILKIDIDSLLVNLGALLLVIGTLQWIFDEGMRKEIVQEISIATLGTDRIYRNGLRDCTENSRKIDEDNLWKVTNVLIIGVHYSNRFIEDNADVIKSRIAAGKSTKIFHINESSLAADYLSESKSGKADIGEKTKNLTSLVGNEFGNSNLIEIIGHDRVLRYSFIKTDQTIWVKFFTNSAGYSVIPAIKVETGTPLFEFFESDINRLLEQRCEL
jgi:hypothetical protein